MDEKREEKRKGIFVIVDGLDGIGKGVVERALIEYEEKRGRAVFNSVAFSKAHTKGLPELADFWDPPHVYYNTIVTAEPTWSGIGKVIRDEVIADNARPYPSRCQIDLYCWDGVVLLNRVVIPALENGLTVLQSRGRAATLCYQALEAEKENRSPEKVRDEILQHPGTQFHLRYRPDLLIIPTIEDVSQVIERIKARKDTQKDDKSIFDTIDFQSRLKPYFESVWLRQIYENAGSKVVYLDAGISPESTRQQAVEIYKEFINSRTSF